MSYLKDTLTAYKDTDTYPFHMPGHKRQALHFPNPYEIDITEIDGFDNLHHAEGILAEAQRRAADLYGSKECFYLINGSTCGLLAAISAAGKRGEKMLVARNSHKAVYHGLFLRELHAEYLYPRITDFDNMTASGGKSASGNITAFGNMTAFGIQGQITPEQVEKAFFEHPDIAAVVITSPTYEGIVSDVEGIAKAAHRHDVPLIVDEAHGAHFGFGAGFPENAVKQGADAVIMSLHKTLPAFTQTALLHVCSDRIDREKIKKYLDIYETSSPSYVLMAGMDSCIQKMETEGRQMFLNYRKKLDSFYESVRDLKRLHVMCREDLSAEDAFDWDDSKIVIFSGTSGMTGEQLYRKLLEEYHLQMELVSGDYVLAMTSVMDTEEGFHRLSAALHEMDKLSSRQMEMSVCKSKSALYEMNKSSGQQCDPARVISKGFIERIYQPNPKEMEIYQAWEFSKKEVSFEEAAGQMAADFIYLYPPGIPMIVPGEIITTDFLDRIRECQKRNLAVEGSANLSSGRINVVYF